MWYHLYKKNKASKQGMIKVHLAFGADKNKQVAAQEHRHLLRLLLLHELEQSKVAPYWWNASFSVQAKALLSQHIAQSGLQPIDIALSEFLVFSQTHKEQALSFSLFSNLLCKLISPIQTEKFNQEDTKLFWEGVKKLLPSCFYFIKKLRRNSSNEASTLKQLVEVLSILSQLSQIEPPENIDVFPKRDYKWLNQTDEEPIKYTIPLCLQKTVIKSTIDWYNYILENNLCEENNNNGKLKYLIQIVQLVRTDIQKAREYYDTIFRE